MNHGDAAPLAAGGIIPASIHSRGACIISKKKKKKPYNHFSSRRSATDGCLLLRFFLGLPRRQLLSDLDQSSGKIYLQPLTNASIYLRFAIVVPSSSPVAHPNSCVVASLRDCIGLHNIILRGGVRSQSPSRALGQHRIFPSFHGSSGSPWGFPPNSFGS